MPKLKLREIPGVYYDTLRRNGQLGLPMRLRLFIFLLLFLIIIMLGVLLILLATGVFQAGVDEHRSILESELNHIAGDISKSFGALSVQTVDLAKLLSVSMERNLKEHGGSAASLQGTPELLEHLLEDELDKLIAALEKSRGSGAFLLLNATVNPELPGAVSSRACLYLKNMEPNIVNGMAANLRYRFGPITMARNNGIYILPQWQMEMDISSMPCFTELMATARENKLPLSRLYRWCEGTSLPDSSERMMLCLAPLIASDGTVFGLCGLEVSEMLFKLTYATELKNYNHLFCLLSPLKDNKLRLSEALFAGSFSPGPAAPERTILETFTGKSNFFSYRQTGKEEYAGLHQIVSLYPADSAFVAEQWTVALMLPQQELAKLISAKNHSLILGLIVLMLVTIGLASFTSHRYIHPVVAALEHVKQSGPTAKTNIPEIDDLIEFLATQDEITVTAEKKKLPAQEHSALYLEFVNNIRTLSAAEKIVFDLYVEGHTAKEIAEILCLSINTIKTHNRRIYTKLNVSSRKELMVYIQMMEEAEGAFSPGSPFPVDKA